MNTSPHARAGRVVLLSAGLLCAFGLLLCAPETRAGVPLGGLAVAVTPDGTRLVAGGDSYALYVLDPKTLAVTQRAYLGRGIRDLLFSPDGTRLFVESTNAVHVLAADTLKELVVHENMEDMTPAAAAGLVVVKDKGAGALRFLSAADGSEKARIDYGSRNNLAGFGVSPDGKRAFLLHYRRKDEGESVVAYKDLPKDLKGEALEEFKQRHDGYTALYQVVDVASGKPTLETTLWFSASGGGYRIYVRGENAYAVGYQNQNARIDAKGELTLFALGNSYNYALTADAGVSTFLSGGLRDGTRTRVEDLKGTAFRIDKLEGFPEYFKGFTFAADGTGYAGTSAWRVVRIEADGTIGKVAPVY